MPRMDRYARANERRRKNDRNIRIMEMWKAGASGGQIHRALNAEGEKISESRVYAIVKRELADAAKRRMEIGDLVLDGELERLTQVAKHAWMIVTEPCPVCSGRGRLEAIPGVGATAETVCTSCMASGKANHPDTRVRAMKEYRAAIDQRVKMMGGYAPEKIAHVEATGYGLDFGKELESVSGDELDQMLNDFAAGVETGKALAKSESE